MSDFLNESRKSALKRALVTRNCCIDCFSHQHKVLRNGGEVLEVCRFMRPDDRSLQSSKAHFTTTNADEDEAARLCRCNRCYTKGCVCFQVF